MVRIFLIMSFHRKQEGAFQERLPGPNGSWGLNQVVTHT